MKDWKNASKNLKESEVVMRERTLILLFLFSGFLLPSISSKGQNIEVVFTYDECGNRILRGIEMRKIEENGKNVENETAFFASATENIGDFQISLYPNPTDDKVVVELSECCCKKGEAILTTLIGTVIGQFHLDGLQHELDLSSWPSGIYLLKLVLDNETRTWKIVKR